MAEANQDTHAPGAMHRGVHRRRSRFARWVGRVALGLAALGAAAAVAMVLMPEPVDVEIGIATRGPLSVTVNEDGRTRVVDRYVVSSPIGGVLGRLPWREGERVDSDTVLATIVPPSPPLLDARSRAEAQARLAGALAAERQAEAQLARAGAAEELATRELARRERLEAGGAVSAVALERTRFEARARADELQSASFGVRVAAEQVAAARAALGAFEGRKGAGPVGLPLRAPVSGTVLRVMRRDAGVVQAGAPLLELGDPGSLEVVVDVLTREAVGIAPGAPVEISGWGGDRSLAAHVQRVEPSAFTRISALGVEEQRVNVVIRLDAPRQDWAALGDGFRVEALIVVWRADDVLGVPASAVFRAGEGWAVYAIERGRARLTAVEVGRRNERQVQVVSGLAAGARVVLHPGDRVVDGARVAGDPGGPEH